MRALSDVLWRERDLLELLVHRLEVERALLETGRTARIALAARETEDVLEQYRTAELGRAAEAAASARGWAGRRTPPWPTSPRPRRGRGATSCTSIGRRYGSSSRRSRR